MPSPPEIRIENDYGPSESEAHGTSDEAPLSELYELSTLRPEPKPFSEDTKASTFRTIRRRMTTFPGSALSFFLLVFLIFRGSAAATEFITHNLNSRGDGHGRARWTIDRSWAQYSPYFPSERYVEPPHGCVIDQVNILQRHGARLPTLSPSIQIASAISKLQAVADSIADPTLSFVRNYTYDLGADRGEPGDLVNSGAIEAFDSGVEQFQRYRNVVTGDNIPFVRASQSDRVVFSATNWTSGFATASEQQYKPTLSVVIPESPQTNNTLEDHMCPAATDSSAQTDEWLSVYGPPITARLNSLAPRAGLDDDDTYALLSLCAFDTVANYRGVSNKAKAKANSSSSGADSAYSPFCALFSEEEFRDFEYHGDLDKFYGRGPGQPLGRIQGVGYANELLARLTSTPVRDHTQTNHTLDSDPATFPLHRSMYVDFSHDNAMVAIFGALGVFWQEELLNTTGRPRGCDCASTGWGGMELGGGGGGRQQRWRTAGIVPFSGRMVVERMTCSGIGIGTGGGAQRYVRILVNDAVQPLSSCRSIGERRHRGGCRGLCELGAFVESQRYARGGGDGEFDRCFE